MVPPRANTSNTNGMKISKMRVAELREQLDIRSLDSTGTRKVLLKRLRDAIQKQQDEQKEEKIGQDVQKQESKQTQHQQQFEQNLPYHGRTRHQQDSEYEDEQYKSEKQKSIKFVQTRDDENQQKDIYQNKSTDSHNESFETEPNTTLTSHPNTTIHIQFRSPPIKNDEEKETKQSNTSLKQHDLGTMNDISIEERIRRRQQRFGFESTQVRALRDAEASKKRRERFGIAEPIKVQKSIEKNFQARLHHKLPLGKVTRKEADHEAMRRRAQKFGDGNGNEEHKPIASISTDVNLSVVEIEKRHVRQKRFSSSVSQE